jgi:1,4-dihydroxy-2-naphthoate octaprenyltransferase
MKHWIQAFRLRTLPLALASIGMGTFLAASSGHFRSDIFALCALTTILLQVLSNLANDYGDSMHGADSDARKGPQRTVQSGAITKKAMKNAIILFVLLSLASGIMLIYVVFGWSTEAFLVFGGMGVLAIIAAITYTAGYRPYGYAGLGDISVLIFFGFVAVLGSAYLYEQVINLLYMLPAISTGLFSVAVLNLNNVRDIESDKLAGKNSIPVRIGRDNAVIYHWVLLSLGFSVAMMYIILNDEKSSIMQYAMIATIPLLLKNAKAVKNLKSAEQLDPYLKQMALITLFFVILFGMGQLL